MPRLDEARRLLIRDGALGPLSRPSGSFVSGPCDATRRDTASPRGWRGLSANDAELLSVFMDDLGAQPIEFHTGVPVGRVPEIPDGKNAKRDRAMVAHCWPRRVDACLRFKEGWWLVECKPDANHYALGQVLCYWFWWCRDCSEPAPVRSVLVTDVADVDVKPVCSVLGIQVVELGRVLGVGSAGLRARRASLPRR